MKWLLLLSLALNVQGYLKLDYEKYQSSKNIRKNDSKFTKKDLDMVIHNQHTYYLTTIEVGSNKQPISVLVDTGSSDLWVMSSDVYCDSDYYKRDLLETDLLSPIAPTETVNSSVATNVYNSNSNYETESDVSTYSYDTAYDNTDDYVFGTDYYDTYFDYETDLYDDYYTSGTCDSLGSFETGSSDSFKVNDTAEEFSIYYASGTSADGYWGNDDVTIQNTTVHGLSFAVATDTTSDISVLGIGLTGLEVTNDGFFIDYTYENLPMKLKSEGIINKNLYSVYLNDASNEKGSVLFGAIDHAKYEGELISNKIVNSMKFMGYNSSARLEIDINEVLFVDDSNTSIALFQGSKPSSNATGNIESSYWSYNVAYPALLDTGSTLSYLPSRIYDTVIKQFKTRQQSRYYNYYFADCNENSGDFQFVFGGATIKVPMSSFMFKPNMTDSDSDYGLDLPSDACMVGFRENDENYLTLGDNFLQHAYIVYDLDDLTISLAQVKFTDEEDIEDIEASDVVGVTASYSASPTSTQLSTSGTTTSNSDAQSDDQNDKSKGHASSAASLVPSVLVLLLGLFTWL